MMEAVSEMLDIKYILNDWSGKTLPSVSVKAPFFSYLFVFLKLKIYLLNL
jgi:hypothetical protein